MSRRMWPWDAEWKFNVRATLKQVTVWRQAANFLGMPIPVYLAHAGTRYAKNLERRVNRVMKKLDQEKERER